MPCEALRVIVAVDSITKQDQAVTPGLGVSLECCCCGKVQASSWYSWKTG